MKGRETIRVGLVGAGYICEYHVRALERVPNVRIVGILDADSERAKATARRFQLSSFSSLQAMNGEGLDVVHILTPPDSHAALALEALALGCHVLVEKPLATCVEDCDRLAIESRARGLQLCVDHSLICDPLIRRALDLVRRGTIGDVLTVDYLRSSTYPAYRGGPLPAHYCAGGYPFRDLGVHALYLIQEFLGSIVKVTPELRSSGISHRDPNIHFDEWRVIVCCAQGTGCIQLSWNIKPMQHQLIIQGTRGVLHVDLFSMFLTRRRHMRIPRSLERPINAISEAASSYSQVCLNAAKFLARVIRPYQGLQNLVQAFYASLCSGCPMPVSLETAKEVVYWTEGIARQADRAKEQSCSKYRPSGQPAVVVTGANGQLGRPLVERLIREGERVRLFVRRLPSDDSVNHPQAEVVVGDLGDPAAVDDVVRGATTVFHLGAAMTGAWADHEAGTIAGTRNVVEACLRHRVARLIYISSLSVLRLAGHPNTEPVTESSPVESAPQLRGYYTQAKLEAERIVLSAINKDKLAAVILRPGQIWSEKGSLLSATIGLRFGRWLVMIGDGSILLPLVSVGDVVEAMILASRSDVAKGQIYHVIDDDVLSRDELLPLYIMAREPHLRKLRLPLSSAIWLAKPIEMIARILRRAPPISPYRIRSAVSKVHFDCSKVRSQLGWRPRTPSAEALRSLLKLRKG